MTTKPQQSQIPTEVTDLVQEVRGLRGDLANTVRKDEAQQKFASRKETNKRRKVSILVVLLTIVLSMQVNTAYVNQCSPGARANAVVDALLDGKLEDVDDVRRATEKAQPEWFCDTVYPFRAAHDEWPSSQNYAGLAMYAFFAWVGYVWYSAKDEDEDFEPEEETPTEG